MAITDNITELLELLNTSENILRTNSSIESDISRNGGTVLYSYNNMIIASEISDKAFGELSKNSSIEFIYEVPLKRYGNVNMDLINQVDFSRIGISIVSGRTVSYQSGSSTIDIQMTAPEIINDDLTISTLINETFSYTILATGSTPIRYEFLQTTIGRFSLSGDTLHGSISKDGIFSIMIKVSNSAGYDIKTLTLNAIEETKITSKLVDYKKVSAKYTYEITSTGRAPKTYSASTLPSGLTLSGNIISGIPTTTGSTDIILSVTGVTGSDSKVLNLNIGEPPIITSLGSVSFEEFSFFEYIITSNLPDNIYSITGSLPPGLTFSKNSITGRPLADGRYYVILKALNPYGENSKELKIVITNLEVGENIFKKGPYIIFGNVNTEMEIRWQDDVISTDKIKWGVDESMTNGPFTSLEYDTDHQHTYTISGLTTNTKYYYQIQVEIGAATFSGSFTSPPETTATSLKFFAYGDSRSEPLDHNFIAQQINSIYLADPEYKTLAIHMGCLTYSGSNESYWTNELFDYQYTNIMYLLRNLVFQSAIGDNDIEGGTTLFTKYFTYNFAGSRYYSFDYGPAHFTVVDQYVDYSSGSTQYNWIVNDLSTSTKNWKFMYMHEPGWSAGGGYLNNTTVQAELEPLCELYGVDVVFAGHNHYYARAMVPTFIVTGSTIPHITTGGGGAPLHTPDLGYPYVVTASANHNFCKINIVNNHILKLEAISNIGFLLDSFTITK